MGKLEPRKVISACDHAIEIFKTARYCEAEMLVQHALKKLISLVQLLPPDMRVYELNHSGICCA